MLRAWWDDIEGRARALRETMGVKFLLTTAMLEHVIQGFVFGGGSGGVVGLPIMFLLGSYGSLTASRMQVLETIAVSPWTLKPIIGIVSDTLFLGGYNKIPYILATTVVAIGACLALVFAWPLGPVGVTLLLFLIFAQIAVADLLIEAKYSEKTAARKEVTPDLWTFIDVGGAVCQALSIVVCGFALTYLPLNYIYLIPVPFFLAALFPIYNNWLADAEYSYSEQFLVAAGGGASGDEGIVMEADGGLQANSNLSVRHNRLTNLCCNRWWYRALRGPEEEDGPGVEPPLATPVVGLDWQKVCHNWRDFLLSLIIAAISLLTSALGLAGIPSSVLFVFALLSAPAMSAAFFLLADKQMAQIQSWVILQNMCSLPVGSAAYRFLTDNAVQYPEGPHFSTFFYVTVMGLVSTAFYFIGVATYGLFMTRWRFRTILWTTNCASIFFSLANVVFYSRLNLRLGIPDAAFVIGSSALQVLTARWASLPLRVLMTQLCPPGMAATGFATLAGSANLGAALAEYQGAFALDVGGVKPTGAAGESAQFANLWILILVGCLLPLVPLALVNTLIPDARQIDDIAAACGGGGEERLPQATDDPSESSSELAPRGEFTEIVLEPSSDEEG
jgi:hypothetical protein